MDLTVFELHLHDAVFNAPFSSGESSRDAAASTRAADANGTAAAGGRLGRLAALAALVGLALLVRSRRGGEAERAAEDEVEASRSW